MILNLTQHKATDQQINAGVVDLQGIELEALKEALTFSSIPTIEEIKERAEYIVGIAIYNGLGDEDEDPFPSACMIGGAPYLMPFLVEALNNHAIEALFSFTERKSVEKTMEDGGVQKTSVFFHSGFVGLK